MILKFNIKSRERIIARQIDYRERTDEMLKALKDSIRPMEDNRKVSL